MPHTTPARPTAFIASALVTRHHPRRGKSLRSNRNAYSFPFVSPHRIPCPHPSTSRPLAAVHWLMTSTLCPELFLKKLLTLDPVVPVRRYRPLQFHPVPPKVPRSWRGCSSGVVPPQRIPCPHPSASYPLATGHYSLP